MSVIRSTGVIVACLLVLCSNVPAATATSAPQQQHSGCSAEESPTHYVVLFDSGTTRGRAESAIADACGDTVIYYDEIAVAVASSSNGNFATRIGPERTHSARTQQHRRPARAGTRGRTVPRQAVPPPAPADQHAHSTIAPWNIRAVNGAEARAINPGSEHVTVAVLDSGIAVGHPALRAALDTERSAGCLSGAPVRAQRAWAAGNTAHGTHIAGIIAGAADDTGVTGVAPGARVASVKVIADNGGTTAGAVICGLMWAARHGMAVANSSFMLTAAPSACGSSARRNVAAEAINRAVRYAESRGTVTVAAATNTGWELNRLPDPRPGTASSASCVPIPASLGDVVTVGALTAEGAKAEYSAYGLGVIDVAAPGGAEGNCVRSTVPGGYARKCGTSMAAAHVSGVLALLASTHPDYSAVSLKRTLRSQGRSLACPTDYDVDRNGRQDAYCTGYAGYNSFYGYGVVNALAAVRSDGMTAQAISRTRSTTDP